VVGTQVVFIANGSTSTELWATGGTVISTRRVYAFAPGTAVTHMVGANDVVHYVTNAGGFSQQMWRSDLSPAGTAPLPDDGSGVGGVRPKVALSNGRVLGIGYDPEHGTELWEVFPAPPYGRLIHDIFPGEPSSMPTAFHELGGSLVLFADNGTSGTEPHVLATDGLLRDGFE
jgi:ELWxxDGT repeat protein